MPSALEQAFAYCLDKWVSKDSRRSFRFQREEGRLFIWDNERRLMQEYSASSNSCETVLDLSNPSKLRPGLPLPPVPVHECEQALLLLTVNRVEQENIEAFTFHITEEGGIVGSSVPGLEGVGGIAQHHVRLRFDAGVFQAQKCSKGLVAFVDSRELDDEWYTLPVPRGTIHLGKALKVSYENEKISVIGIVDASSSHYGRPFLDRSEILREKKRRKGLHGYEEGIKGDADDIFESVSSPAEKRMSKAGIGHGCWSNSVDRFSEY